MIVRLVRMRFRPEEVERFLALYERAYPVIVGQPGCRSVQLVREETIRQRSPHGACGTTGHR